MTADTAPAVTQDELAAQAAQWIVRLTGDDPAGRSAACEAFDAWKRADPRHAAAAAGMEGFIGQVRAARGATGSARPARAGLDAALANGRGRLKRIGTALVAVFLLAAPAWLVLRTWPPGYLLADLRTATGQWQTRTLADGSRITLDGASAVNLHYDGRRRAIELVRGAILVEVAKDPARPFLVETAQGRIRALGTRFVVDRRADATVLSMIESRVSVQAATPRAAGEPQTTEVRAGQRVRITAGGVGPAEPVDPRSLSDAWDHHLLVASDRPLAEVLDELARHQRGYLHYDAARIVTVRVSTVLPLDDPGRALKLLQAGLPALRVRTVTPWLVLVDAPPVAGMPERQ